MPFREAYAPRCSSHVLPLLLLLLLLLVVLLLVLVLLLLLLLLLPRAKGDAVPEVTSVHPKGRTGQVIRRPGLR
jgi:hypothetical protein